jgi:hypothetical protein
VFTPDVVLRRAGWSELLFALIALLLALGLPLPPRDGRTWFLLVHWYAMTVVALWLVVVLRHPSRLVWAVAVALSVYFLTSVLLGLGNWRPDTSTASGGMAPFVVSPLLVGMAALTQISVAIRCWQSRTIRVRRAGPPDPDEVVEGPV